MQTQNALNLSSVRQAVDTNPKFKTLLELYATRQRGRQDSTVSRALRILKDEGFEQISKSEVSQFYRDLQKAGAGHWVSGRNGKEGRFVWDFHLVSLAQAVLNATSESKVEAAPAPKVKLPKVSPSAAAPLPAPVVAKPEPAVFKTPQEPAKGRLPQKSEHKVRVLRAGFEIEFPADLDPAEYRELAAFLKEVAAGSKS